MGLQRLVFGTAVFGDGEEYRQFQYRFACVLTLFSVVTTALFILTALAGLAVLDDRYVYGGSLYCAVMMGIFACLRRWPQHLPLVAPVGVVASFLIVSVAFFHNTADEMRIIWYPLSIPGAYILAGRRVGLVLAAVSVAFILWGNGQLADPYSPSAIITTVVAVLYITAFFHAVSSRSVSFHQAMVVANRALRDLAARDPLTGLMNARAYYEACGRVAQQARRSGLPLAMLFVDLDHFKRINDTYGHEAGDRVLRAVASCLRTTLRQSDLVGRIGGEEFSVLLPETGTDGALRLAEALRQSIEGLCPEIKDGQCLTVTASIGVAVAGVAPENIAELQRQADEGMYQAKQAGRNRVSLLIAAAGPV